MCRIIKHSGDNPGTAAEVLELEYTRSIDHCRYNESELRHHALDVEMNAEQSRREGKTTDADALIRSRDEILKKADAYSSAADTLTTLLNELPREAIE